MSIFVIELRQKMLYLLIYTLSRFYYRLRHIYYVEINYIKFYTKNIKI